ncbi:hypothetical protein ROJ8625_03616 [Roseivivax jejudonensis]|uniref:PemK-like protein n=1 Tax=Roseivivax jejudonensis TaxID=1529041 RepID=A0A1X7A3E2_9RHOB|nr:hypothetical protein [Roseivivax jejudonensis]SLN69488.1 hypothetical protein ROJ8625_03616 [Roseivivax jejudonensis]
MLHADIPQAAAWQETIKPGDIVAFRMPHKDPSAEPLKARPTLVLDIEDIDGTSMATLAYGTTRPPRGKTGHLVPVTDPDEIVAASLDRPTRFDPHRTVLVTLSHNGFVCRRSDGSAIIGTLSGTSAQRLARARKTRRAARRRHRSHLRRQDKRREVVVERRRGARLVSKEVIHA